MVYCKSCKKNGVGLLLFYPPSSQYSWWSMFFFCTSPGFPTGIRLTWDVRPLVYYRGLAGDCEDHDVSGSHGVNLDFCHLDKPTGWLDFALYICSYVHIYIYIWRCTLPITPHIHMHILVYITFTLIICFRYLISTTYIYFTISLCMYIYL